MHALMHSLHRHRLAAIAVGGASVIALIAFVFWLPGSAPGYPVQRTVQLEMHATNTTAAPLEHASLSLYAPVTRTAHQRLDTLSASADFEPVQDALGNQVMVFDLGTLAPHETRIVRVRAELALSDAPNPGPAGDRQRFTAAEPFVELEAPAIQQIAQQLSTNGKAANTSREAWRWVNTNIRDAGYIARDLGARHAAEERWGDCTEFAYLLTALARSHGIPARTVAGYLMAQNGTLRPHTFHNWTEVYFDGAWQLLDAHQGHFAENQSGYIATRIITTPEDSLLGSVHRFRSDTDGLRVRMK